MWKYLLALCMLINLGEFIAMFFGYKPDVINEGVAFLGTTLFFLFAMINESEAK